MRLFLILLVLPVVFTPQIAFAQAKRVEDWISNIIIMLKNEEFEALERMFESFRKNDTKTRHGTDMADAVMDEMTKRFDSENSLARWKEYTNKWAINSPNNFIPNYLLIRLKHHEAWNTQNSDTWNTIPQSQQRKYKAVLSASYTLLYKLNEKHPKEWRGHSYLVENFEKFKLTADELAEHYQKVQSLKPYEVSSMIGYLRSLSPYALGRDDDAIILGIEKVLQKYPDKNLSKPEYISAEIKQEMEDAIFEYMITKMLREANQLIQKAPKNETAAILIPTTYKRINEDLNRYYRNNKEKADKHPLSYNNPVIEKQIETSYLKLENNFPESGKYLIERLETKLDKKDREATSEIIDKIIKNDPDYEPTKLQPILCKYFSGIASQTGGLDAINQMFNSCKNASKYVQKKIFYYRTGWAARRRKDFATSNTFIEQALALEPDNDLYMTDLCWNNKDLKDYNKALDYCDKALETNQDNARAWLGRSHIYYYGFNNIEQSQKDAMMYERLRKQKN